MDKNVVFLEGSVGEDLNYGKTQDGKEFGTFSLLVNGYSREYHDSSERNHSFVMIRVMVFERSLVERMRELKVRSGTRVSIFARLNSHRSEYRGVSYIQNDVVVRDLAVIKSK